MMRRTRDYQPDPQLSSPLGECGDEVVRILTGLTGDLERFDSMIDRQRNMLERRSDQLSRDVDIHGESLLVRQEAAEMATRTQRALAELRRLGEPVEARRRRLPPPRRRASSVERTTLLR
jgi:hypothetical protein